MYKTVIVEGEGKQLVSLRKIINENYPLIDIAGEVTDIRSVQKVISVLKPDLVILNTHLSRVSIFKFLESLSNIEFECIFMSKDDSCSLKAIKYNAVDYLVKPFRSSDLEMAIQKAIQKITKKSIAIQKDLIVGHIHNLTNNNMNKIAIPTLEGFVFIHMEEIIRFESNGTYTYIFTSKKEKIIASKNIKEFEEMLPKTRFFRVHNSHLVNINRLLKYNKGRGGTITMEDGTQIEVASRRRNQFLNLFQV